jgi:hypothetical protein
MAAFQMWQLELLPPLAFLSMLSYPPHEKSSIVTIDDAD